jgi:hypothetical protein
MLDKTTRASWSSQKYRTQNVTNCKTYKYTCEPNLTLPGTVARFVTYSSASIIKQNQGFPVRHWGTIRQATQAQLGALLNRPPEARNNCVLETT